MCKHIQSNFNRRYEMRIASNQQSDCKTNTVTTLQYLPIQLNTNLNSNGVNIFCDIFFS